MHTVRVFASGPGSARTHDRLYHSSAQRFTVPKVRSRVCPLTGTMSVSGRCPAAHPLHGEAGNSMPHVP